MQGTDSDGSILQKIVDIALDFADAYHNRGMAYGKKGNYNHAIKDYNKVIELNLDSGIAYYNRGIAYRMKGNYEHAIEDYTRVIELEPDNTNAYYRRSKAWLHLGETEKAKADMKTASKIGINSGTALDETLKNYDRAWKTLGNL